MKTRKVKKPPRASAKGQGSKGPIFTQSPRPGGGKPVRDKEPARADMSKLKPVKKPGSGTRGSGKGAH